MPSPFDDSSPVHPLNSHFLLHPEPEDEHHAPHFDQASSDGDTASQRSIALSSPPHSPRLPIPPSLAEEAEDFKLDTRTPITYVREGLVQSKRSTLDTDLSSDVDDDRSFFTRRLDEGESPISSVAPSVDDREKIPSSPPPVTPALASPPPSRPSAGIRGKSDTESIVSFASEGTSYSKKARPESLLPQAAQGPLVLGIALVDFDHLVGPKVEFSRGSIFEDEEIVKILPFLALPDGAHLSSEDYSYFHLVPSSPNPTTIFGISCNRQISTSELLVKDAEVTRSTVQKAVVVLASKPVFGLIRDRLGVITRALFAQRDFSDMTILDDFHSSLEYSLRGQMTESGLYMGTSLRELVHTFRQRTLVLLKALMLQKKIMFYGHPVERLCTYQYSLVTLVPGLLQHLDDCGSPPLATRAQNLSQPTSLRTSDHKSVLAYVGLPLDLFGKDAFFQPYLPLQQLDMLKDTQSWLCGSTNSIVTQQKEVEVLVNVENGTMEFRDPKLERIAGLTAADRKWMDEILRDVNETFDDDPTKQLGMHFKGSDDYLRQKFEEYISSALASVKYADFLAKAQGNGVSITDTGDPNSMQDFNALFIKEFKKTNAFEVWDRVTDPMLFDIVEARHPCYEKPSVVADIGLRLSEGIQELKLDQQLAPTREAISRTLNVGSNNLMKAMEGVRGRWLARNASSSNGSQSTATTSTNSSSMGSSSTASSVEEMAKSEAGASGSRPGTPELRRGSSDGPRPQQRSSGLRPLSMARSHPIPVPAPPPPVPPVPEPSRFSGWVGSLFSQRSSRSSLAPSRRESSPTPSVGGQSAPMSSPPTRDSVGKEMVLPSTFIEELPPDLQPKNLDEVYGAVAGSETHPSTSSESHIDSSAEHEDEEIHQEPASTGIAV